jgi:drug/metabolite transporter (DMT)-like permease
MDDSGAAGRSAPGKPPPAATLAGQNPASAGGAAPAATGPAPSATRTRPAKGIFWMCTAAFGSSSMNGMIREASADIHAFEIAFFRNVFGFIALLPMLLKDGIGATMRTAHPWLHTCRGLLNAVAMLSFFYAVTVTPLATVAALGFTAPLFAAVLAIPILGERPGWRRWAGLLIGFIGALVIVRPGFDEVTLGTVMVLLSSAAWAGALIIIKILARTESSLTITIYAALFLTPITLAAALFVWSAPTPLTWLLLVGIGIFGSLTQWSIAQAFHEADATVVLPFDFTKLLWASAIGYLVFAEIPDPLTLLGGSIILASVTYVAYRERQNPT